jgi:uncharacterized membrane protein YjjP (DUF1212 family)
VPGPSITLGFILATLFGAVFHLIFGGDARRLALFLLAGWIGFGLGHMLGVIFSINILNIGTLRMVAASIGALTALAVAYVLTSNRPGKRVSREGLK